MRSIQELRNDIERLENRIVRRAQEYNKEFERKWYELSDESYLNRIIELGEKHNRIETEDYKKIDELNKQIAMIEDGEWTKG